MALVPRATSFPLPPTWIGRQWTSRTLSTVSSPSPRARSSRACRVTSRTTKARPRRIVSFSTVLGRGLTTCCSGRRLRAAAEHAIVIPNRNRTPRFSKGQTLEMLEPPSRRPDDLRSAPQDWGWETEAVPLEVFGSRESAPTCPVGFTAKRPPGRAEGAQSVRSAAPCRGG